MTTVRLNTAKLDQDFYVCPLTRQAIRHPVLAADGYRYEACRLLAYLNNSPNTVSPLTRGELLPVAYDRRIEQLIDQLETGGNTAIVDRHGDYPIEGLVDQINSGVIISHKKDFAHERAMARDIGQNVLGQSLLYLSLSIFIERALCSGLNFTLNGGNLEEYEYIKVYAFVLLATLTASIVERNIRMANDNSHGILGAIAGMPGVVANRYYGLFIRQDRIPVIEEHENEASNLNVTPQAPY